MVFLVAVHYSYFSQVENILDHCHFHHEAFPVMELDKIMVECLLTLLSILIQHSGEDKGGGM